VALAVLFVVAGLAAIAARSGVMANSQSFRDRNVKRAIQAAGAGMDAAVYQLNVIQPQLQQCVNRTSAGALELVAVPSDGWCTAQTENLGDNASYSFRVTRSSNLAFNSNGQVMTQRSIVSTGLVNGVERRVFARVTAPAGDPILFPKGFAVVSLQSVTYGSSVRINGHLGSNGRITLQNTARVCGNATPGVGQSVVLQNSASVCAGYSKAPAQQPFALAPVNQYGANLSNNNARICASGAGGDPCTSPSRIAWDPTARTLLMEGGSTLTLSGNVYSFCRIELRNTATIRVAARSSTTPLRIYMDSPENCGGTSGMGSVVVGQTAGIDNLNTDPATFALLVAGSATRSTTVDLGQSGSPGPSVVMGIYAPYSTVNLLQSIQLVGAAAARQVLIGNSASVTYDSHLEAFAENAVLKYRHTDYIECTSRATTSAPDSGC
jgi:type II secretory pathway pseudopilin PulG